MEKDNVEFLSIVITVIVGILIGIYVSSWYNWDNVWILVTVYVLFFAVTFFGSYWGFKSSKRVDHTSAHLASCIPLMLPIFITVADVDIGFKSVVFCMTLSLAILEHYIFKSTSWIPRSQKSRIQCEALQHQNEILKSENDRLSTKLSELMSKELIPVSVMNAEISKLQSQIKFLQNNPYDRDPELKKLKHELEFLDKQYADLAAQHETLSRNHDELVKKFVQLASESPQYALKYILSEIINIPQDVYFVNGCVPVQGTVSQYKPFGNFTVYVAQRGRCYHMDYHCGSALLYARHAYDVIGKLPPCKNCGHRTEKCIPEWYKEIKKIQPGLISPKNEDYYRQLDRAWMENVDFSEHK